MFHAAAFEVLMDTEGRFLHMLLYPLAFLGYKPTSDWMALFCSAVQAKAAGLAPQQACMILTGCGMVGYAPPRAMAAAVLQSAHAQRASFSNEQLAWLARGLLAARFVGGKEAVFDPKTGFMAEVVARKKAAEARGGDVGPAQKAFAAWEALAAAMIKTGSK